MKSRIRMTCPRDQRSFEFVVFKGNDWERGKVREMVTSWGKAHRACAELVSLPERSKPHRCGDCGLELLFGEPCPLHPASQRVRWARELSLAYEETVKAVAGGLQPRNRNEVEHQAIVLAQRWGNLEPERVA